MQLVSWATVKFYLDSTLESARYSLDDSFYYVFAGDFWCKISLTLPGDAADLADWTTNYLPLANVISNEIKIRGGTDGTIIGNAGDRLKLDVIFSADQLIKVSPDDLTSGYLEAKVLGTANKVVVSTANPGGAENLQINIGSHVFDKSVNTTDNITEGVTNLFFTNERAQDAVGTILTDTASVDFTYNDAGNTISAAVLPDGVNHNSLQNYVANQHIDHSTVSITAGTGLSGGGDITTSRTVNLADTGVSAGSYGTTTQHIRLTVNAQGQITTISNITPANNLVNTSVTATASTTTTSGTDVLINGMTITPVSGTYFVIFSTCLTNTGTNGDVAISIYSAGAINSHSERVCSPQFFSGGLGGTPSLSFPIETHAVVTVNGSQAIEARWRRSTGTAGCTTRSMTIIKVG